MSTLHKFSKVGIYVTPNAWKKLEEIVRVSKNKLGYIFYATSGGCNGFNFKLDLLDKKNYNDINGKTTIFLQNNNLGPKLYIDPRSEMFLLGTTIDYIKENYAKGIFENKFIFKVNPKLTASCGCGISFSPKNL